MLEAGVKRLRTARLHLLPAHPAWATATAAFFARNAAHLAPWEPRRPGLADVARQVEWLSQAAASAAEGSAWRWLLSRDGFEVLGSVSVSQVVRGFHHSAALGYALDAGQQGQGLMHEALQAIVAEVFDPAGHNLHRLQAAYRPENVRSARVLQRLGFRSIGLARDYLCIDGAWRDHVLCERVNLAFREDATLR